MRSFQDDLIETKALIQKGEFESALETLDKLMVRQPNDEKLIAAKIQILTLGNRFSELQENIEIYGKLFGENKQYNYLRIRTLIRRKEISKAKKLLDELLLGENQKHELIIYLGSMVRDFRYLHHYFKKTKIETLKTSELATFYHACAHTFDIPTQSILEPIILKKLAEENDFVEPLDLLAITDDPQVILKNNKSYYENLEYHLKDLTNTEVAKAKITIAYYSPDFKSHPITHLIAGLIKNHDRNKFNVLGFSLSDSVRDKFRKRISLHFDQFFEIENLSDRSAIQLSRDMGVDIAIDLAGFTALNRPGLFMNRVAKTQINYLGTPSTLGSDCHDYIITDRTLTNPEDEIYLTETPIYMDHCFQVNDNARYLPIGKLDRNFFGLPERKFVIGCFSSLSKLNDALLTAWIEILASNNETILFIFQPDEEAHHPIRAYFEHRGISGSRIYFASSAGYEVHLERYLTCDLVLDTAPFCGGATASDVLWAGVPLISLYGKSYSSRMSSSLLRCLGLEKLICSSFEEYVEVANKFIADKKFREEIMEILKERRNSKLFDTKTFTLEFEKKIISAIGTAQKQPFPS
jgi:predicted O-linked N-acetylglucosamine transferase (SPINDLY family)